MWLPISLAMMWARVVLPEPRRAGQKDMVQRLAALPCRGDEDLQILRDLFLSAEILETQSGRSA